MSKPVERVALSCSQCSQSFSIAHWEYKRGRGKFCSRACTNAARVGVRVTTAAPVKGETRVCRHCSRSFWASASLIRKGGGKCCSQVCANASRRKQVAVTCRHCSQPFTAKPSVVTAGGGVYCSLACSHKSRAGVRPAPIKRRQQPITPAPPKPSQRPAPVTPRADDLPLVDGGSHVRCHGCQEFRPRGQFCARCEHRAAEFLAS
jgi:hypothetical protein